MRSSELRECKSIVRALFELPKKNCANFLFKIKSKNLKKVVLKIFLFSPKLRIMIYDPSDLSVFCMFEMDLKISLLKSKGAIFYVNIVI